jgi:uncharacterized protein (TIGR03437 family)
VTAGWGQVNFIVPEESAPGSGWMTIQRADGSMQRANITIADTAPGFWTGVSCRGPALGSAIRKYADGRTARSPLSACAGGDCKTIPVAVVRGGSTQVQVKGSGLRNAGSAGKIEVTIGGKRVPVVGFGPSRNEPGIDQLTVEIPASLRGLGEADLLCYINGRVSNPVRIRIGG